MDFLRRQWVNIPYPEQDLTGQTTIVTGANIGLGLEAARHFTRMGASKVILACRSASKGQEAVKSIEKSTQKQGICEVWPLDMEDFDSIKAFAKRAEKLDRIDVMLENAGVSFPEYTWSEKANMETTIAVNVVGTFLLSLLILPVLRKSGKEHGVMPRLTITSSDVHIWVRILSSASKFRGTRLTFLLQAKFAERKESSIFEALKKDNKEYIADRYSTSKLLEVFTVRALAAQMTSGPHASEKVILNAVNPGLCHSSLSRNITGIQSGVFYVMKQVLARTTEVGGRTLVASAVAGEESHGKYMSEAKITEPSVFVRSDEGKETQQRVYKELMGILEKIQPGVTGNI